MLAGLQYHAVADLSLESGQFRPEHVFAVRQSGKDIAACRVRQLGAFLTATFIYKRQGDTRQDASCGVDDRSPQLGSVLRQQRNRCQAEEQHPDKDSQWISHKFAAYL